MAQTKKKRRTKHRGNAAGMVEARGRTGRKPTGSEVRSGDKKAQAAARRRERLDRVPTWRSAFNKAAIAALVFAVLSKVALGSSVAGALGLLVFTFAIYVPLSFYTDQFIYRRAQKRRSVS